MPLPLFFTRTDLQTRVAEWPASTPDTSWALCIMAGAIPGAGELRAIREAAKICDRVAVVKLDFSKTAWPSSVLDGLEKAGADILWCPREAPKGTLNVGVEKTDAGQTLVLMQAITAVLPNLVMADRTHLLIVRVLRNILTTFGDLFTLRVV